MQRLRQKRGLESTPACFRGRRRRGQPLGPLALAASHRPPRPVGHLPSSSSGWNKMLKTVFDSILKTSPHAFNVTIGFIFKCSSKEEEEDKAEQPGDLLSHLSQFLYQKLGLGNDEEPVHILDEASVDGIVRYIQSGKCKNIIAMIGAGISTAAGIPDFRSPSSGIYSKLGKFNLPSPEAIFEIGYFRRNPAPFYALARQLFPQDLKPTLSHYFLRLLHEKGLLLRLYTQNIDCLERLAGIPAEAIVEAHGTFHSSHCLSCNHEYSLDWLRERIAAEPVPLCLDCGCPVKPDIVFFGERLPDRFFDLSEEDFARCDLLLIVGTSLQVQPFAGLVDKVHNSIPRLLINLEKCGQGNLVSKILGLGCGLEFDSEANFRDVALLGTCDSGCQEMADRLGWKDDLLRLIEKVEAAKEEAVEAKANAAKAEQNVAAVQPEVVKQHGEASKQ
ncbi:NAD-dependent protein deacetylase sirtuin-2 isoform X3 [Dermacentor silvarum]|uniref:NAD-dependent protein deacetylase sirtuin-2 isoform X3 n=1 Tax=Dermacentor silvarum TaxID=543639 RepID=UPI0021018855|nr:NAD-dependent protein deacetylase sirtuin-2 isoform X3 [Dermacentor silvarum]